MAGSLDNDVTVWDIRNSKIDYKLQGHTDTITGIRLSPNGSHLLSNSMDNTGNKKNFELLLLIIL